MTDSQSSNSFRTIQGEGFEGVIVPASTAAEHWRYAHGRAPESEWEVDHASIEKLETQLQGFLAQHSDPRAQALAAKLETYKRQYLAVKDSGKNLIELRGVCDEYLESSGDDWQSRVIQVDDGGDCFFEVMYDADGGQITAVSIHSES